MLPKYHYAAYGLRIDSMFQLPELLPSSGGQDVAFLKKKITLPASLEPADCYRQGVQAHVSGDEKQAFLHWGGIGSFLAEGGANLFAEAKTSDAALFRSFLLSEALGLVLFQRGFFLLHASAVVLGNHAVVFLGTPGAGKSSTVAAFAQAGHTVLADDLVAITFDAQNRPLVAPAFPQVKIWKNSAEGLGMDAGRLAPLFPGSTKFILRQPGEFPQAPVPLKHLIVISPGQHLPGALAPVLSQAAFLNLTRYFPLPSQLLKGEKLKEHFGQAALVARQAKMWNLGRPADFGALTKFVESPPIELLS